MDVTVEALDVLTGARLAVLPLSIKDYGVQISAVGSLSGELYLTNDAATSQLLLNATQPRRTMIVVVRDSDGVAEWCGIIYGRDYDSESGRLSISASTYEGWLRGCVVEHNYPFSQWDQLDMIRNFIDWQQQVYDHLAPPSQAYIGGNVRMTYDTQRSGVIRDHTYYGKDRKTLLEVFQQLAARINGFEFNIIPRAVGQSSWAPHMRLGYPKLGSESGNAPVLEYGPIGDVVSYQWSEDGSEAATHVAQIGGTREGEQDPVIGLADNRSAGQPVGYPRQWSVQSDHNDVVLQPTIDGYAQLDAAALRYDTVVPSVILRTDGYPSETQWTLGDTLRLRITDPRRFPVQPGTHAPGLDTLVRVIGWKRDVEGGTTELLLDEWRREAAS